MDQGFTRATPRSKCPICGKGGYCYGATTGWVCMHNDVAPDGTQGISLKSGKPGWRYPYDREKGLKMPPPRPKGPPTVNAAPVEVRDLWYRELLNILPLHPVHQDNLLARGLSGEVIKERKYRSFPLDRRDYVKRVMDRLGEPIGIPGFSQHPEKGYWRLHGAPGMLVPVLDQNGLIVGCQIRRDEVVGGEPRYVWLSSDGKGVNGATSGAPCHVARSTGITSIDHPDVLWITEGPLKADRLVQWQKTVAVAVPGVSVIQGALHLVRTLHPKKVIVAYDMDKMAKKEVQEACDVLLASLSQEAVAIGVASWNPVHKGIDDALQAGMSIRVNRYEPKRQVATA